LTKVPYPYLPKVTCCYLPITAHNHPSGNIEPSEADKNITKKIIAGCDAIDIKLLDHLIIVPKGGCFSFADKIII